MRNIYFFISGEWKKINDQAVCFGARDDSYGAFNIKENGLIDTFKLVHKQGSLRCSPNYPGSYWGCMDRLINNRKKKLTTVITYSNNTALLLAEYNRGVGCHYYAYRINGVHVNSTELVFNNLSTPLRATVGQEFRIWHARDLVDCSEENNSGTTCADVYAWYN